MRKDEKMKFATKKWFESDKNKINEKPKYETKMCVG